MFKKQNHIIIGLTTFHTEFLRISVPAIARLKQKVYLIIHNDNPAEQVTARQIRKFGYRGPLHIINTTKNGGQLVSRLNILSAIDRLGILSEWMIFVDDDDLLIDLDIPTVKNNNFAIMQNMVFIRKRLLDLFRVMDNPKNYKVDDEHVTIERPHIGIVGTLLRTNTMIRLGKLMRALVPQIHEIDASLSTRQPEDIVMWFYLQIYARHLDPMAEPIYMDRANYIAIILDTASQKYGRNLIRTDQPAEYYETIMNKYCALLHNLLQNQ